MKQLETRATNIVICWNNLKNIPPKEFPTIEEMEKVLEMLTTFEETVPAFAKIIKEGEELNTKIVAGEMLGDDIQKARKDWMERSSKLEAKEKERKIVVELENEVFNTFFQQFERWGKNWFNRVDEFLAFRKDITDANSRPLGVAKKK